MRTSMLVAASAGTIVTGLLAYAVYFDHKRQTDPEFRRSLKKNNRRLARAVKEEAEAHGAMQREAIKKAFQQAQAEGFPTDLEEKESFFMSEVAKGESLCSEDTLAGAICFWKALHVYPQPKDLISIYERTVPKEVLEVLAELIAMDTSLKLGGAGAGGADAGVDE
ncbi:hypothetical protein PHISCL_06938 [Aspergillus sclerotialis]|uniref:Mitochondrial import receptor subunit TOM20 n=1 Tax=Aspergillus sclerotialis TaxID=2070753 RepID=A0A3A2ZH56_9EURO|nr:hypothetical protein PHISCL_06938 [Aspergillus sclerotialis]